MGNDFSEPKAKETSYCRIERKFMREWASLLENLAVMNATKTELRLYTLASIIAVDTILNSVRNYACELCYMRFLRTNTHSHAS